MGKIFHVYMMTNPSHSVIYTGITNDLKRRVYEHKCRLVPGFTKQYHVINLVYMEAFSNAKSAIAREKQIKAGSRAKKESLICDFNKQWRDLYSEI